MSSDNMFVQEMDAGVDFDSLINSLEDSIDDNLMISGDKPIIDKSVNEKKAEVSKEPVVAEESDEDDLLALLDDEEVEGDDDDTPEEESDTEEGESDEGDDTEVTVVVDGEEITVSMDELKKGYSRHSDYTKKTQELAEQRKAIEAESKSLEYLKVQRELQPEYISYQEDIKKIDEAKDALLKGYYVDDNGQPVQLSKEQYKATKENVEDAEREAQWKLAKINEKMSQVTPPKLEELQKEVPELFSADEAVLRPVLDNFAGILRDVGYSQVEIDSTNDPRLLLLLKKVADGNELQSRVEKAKARKGKTPGTTSKPTPSSKKTSKSRKASGQPKDYNAMAKSFNEGANDVSMEDFLGDLL